MQKKIMLPLDYALVLQQISVVGEEDILSLAESLRMDPPRLEHIIRALRNKQLVLVRRRTQDLVVSLTKRGRRFLKQLWPEAAAYRQLAY